MGYILNDANCFEIYAITTHATGTKKLTLIRNIDITPDFDSSRVLGITFTQEEDSPTLYTFIAEALPGTSIPVVEPERTYTNGDKHGGTLANSVSYIGVLYGGVPLGATQRKITVLTLTVDPTSGGWKTAFNTVTNPKFIVKSIRLAEDVTVTKTVFNTAFVDEPATDVTITKELGYSIVFLDLPA